MPLAITFLLAETGISGIARKTLVVSDALAARGHRIRIATADLPLTWRSSSAEWLYVDFLDRFAAGGEEFVIGTSEATMADARRAAGDRAVAWPLAEPVVEQDFFRTRLPRENVPLRVLLTGSWEEEKDGIADGYGAVAHARWFHQKLELVRVSSWAPSREEPSNDVQEFHVALSADEMTRVVHSADVVLAPAREGAITLSAAEAIASDLPAVMTRIPSHDAVAERALLAPPGNAVELGERLIELLSDPALRARLREAKPAAVEQWRPERAAEVVERAVDEVRKRIEAGK